MPQIISFHCISRHFALGSKTTSASSQGIVPVGRFRSGQSSERLNRGLPLQNDLVDQMIHHEQYKVLWNQYQLPNSDVKNGKVNTVFGFSSTISKFIMSPPWTLTDHSNIDVKNVVNYSHLNLIHFNNKAIYEMEIDSQLVIQCVLHDYVLVFKYPSDHILHDSAWRSQNSMELANTSLPRRLLRASTRGKELVIKPYEPLQGRLRRNLSWRALGSCFLVPDLKTLDMFWGWEICVRVWEGRGGGSSVHVYRTCRRISRYGFCLSGGGVGLELRMTSSYLIKLTGCSSDVFENTSKRKKNFIS